MTDIDLDALEATARGVRTPGPWETRCEGYGEPTRVCHDSEYVIYLGYDYAADFGASDAEHIAAFDPPTVLALITRLREAEARVEPIERGWRATARAEVDAHRRLQEAESVIETIRADAVELLDADDDSYDGSLSATWVVDLIARYKTTKTEKEQDQ